MIRQLWGGLSTALHWYSGRQASFIWPSLFQNCRFEIHVDGALIFFTSARTKLARSCSKDGKLLTKLL